MLFIFKPVQWHRNKSWVWARWQMAVCSVQDPLTHSKPSVCFFIVRNECLENELITNEHFSLHFFAFFLALCWLLNKSWCAFWISNNALRTGFLLNISRWKPNKTHPNQSLIPNNSGLKHMKSWKTIFFFKPGQMTDSQCASHSTSLLSSAWLQATELPRGKHKATSLKERST